MTLEIVAQRIATLEEQMVLVMSKINSDEPKAKGKKAKKDKAAKADAPPKKKRGTTGYLMFASDARPGVKEELIEGGNEKPKPTEVITEVAKKWKALSEEEQGVWNEKAKDANSASDED